MADARRLYRQTLVGWAQDCLSKPVAPRWPEPDPDSDCRDRDWSRLYRGSVLDD